eukprot:gb/GECH01010071.1/.p1 GENE.gb/GECH01010071.1/~~gb/GECH01010071.1/.p1  ORF type:complete len:145 (+),score=27.34 gb/GECH01010071.1/:1-435(+)
MAKGVTVKDVPAAEFIKEYAAHLKRTGKIQEPKWVDIAKTGVHRQLPPQDPDWYYIRLASMSRRLYMRPGAGIGAFRKVYGSTKNRGVKPNHFTKAAGGVIRNGLQQLEELKLVEKSSKGGRLISSIGQRDMDRIAGRVATKLK